MGGTSPTMAGRGGVGDQPLALGVSGLRICWTTFGCTKSVLLASWTGAGAGFGAGRGSGCVGRMPGKREDIGV